MLLDEEKRLLRREKTRKKTGVTNTRRALLVAIGQHRLAYEIEGLLDAKGSCVSAALDCMTKLSALHSEQGEDHRCDKIDSDKEAIEQLHSKAVEEATRHVLDALEQQVPSYTPSSSSTSAKQSSSTQAFSERRGNKTSGDKRLC